MSILALPNELLDHIVSQITYSCDKDGRLRELESFPAKGPETDVRVL